MDEYINLKPCPFCGVIPEIELYEDMCKRKKWGIECRNSECDVTVMTDWYADKQECIEAWNRRVREEEKR